MSAEKTEFRIADTEEEFGQIAKLNYRTFVEEIPQHSPNAERSLRDKLHGRNTYAVAKRGGKVVGMLALNTARPFSLDAKIPDLDSRLGFSAKKPCEVRLLAIDGRYRKGKVLLGLIRSAAAYCTEHGVDTVLISAITREMRMYESFGFVPFHPPVGKDGAVFIPMYLKTDNARTDKWRL